MQGGQTVAIVRYSERPSFDNLPRCQWDSVELMRTGTEVATAFGAELAAEGTIKCLQTFSWGLKRSWLTSQAISHGARQAGCRVLGPSSLQLKSPIANHEEYEKAFASGQWDRFVSDWLNGNDPQVAMVPARQYAKEVYRSLLGADLCVRDHDHRNCNTRSSHTSSFKVFPRLFTKQRRLLVRSRAQS